MTIIK